MVRLGVQCGVTRISRRSLRMPTTHARSLLSSIGDAGRRLLEGERSYRVPVGKMLPIRVSVRPTDWSPPPGHCGGCAARWR